ncbi:MAG: FAD-binding oxidoreductase [Myxococcaceae bacterium]
MSASRVELSGWGLYPKSSCEVREPETEAGVRAALDPNGTIARGLGRSYGDAATNDLRVVLDMTRMDRVLSFDEATGEVRCEAGVSLSALIERFAPRGFFPLITPGTRFVTVGGCIANDVHGKAHHAQGSFLESVKSMRVLLADGRVVECSREREADLFFASFGGMGLLGVILEATLQLRKVSTTWFRQQSYEGRDLDELLDLMAEHDARVPYSVASINPLATGRSLGTGVLTCGDHAQPDELPAKFRARMLAVGGDALLDIPVRLPELTLNPLTLRVVHAGIRQVMLRAAPLVHADQFFYPLDGLLSNWNRGYGRRGFTQYQFVIPKADGPKNLRALLTTIVEAKQLPTLNVLKRMGPGNAAPLSFPMEGYTLAIDFPILGDTAELAHRLDAMVEDMGGRIYLGKDAFLRPESFNRMYPRHGEWRAVKRRVDPNELFSSDLSRRVGLTAR